MPQFIIEANKKFKNFIIIILSMPVQFSRSLFLTTFAILLLFVFSIKGFGQCSNFGNNYPYQLGGFSTTSASWTTLATDVYGSDWSCFELNSSYVYQWKTCGSSWDSELTLYTSSTASTSGANRYNDDACSTQSRIAYAPSANGGVSLLVSEFNCISNSTSGYLYWRAIPKTPTISGGDVTVCSGTGVILTATNATNDSEVDVQWSSNNFSSVNVSSDATSVTVYPTTTTTYYVRYYVYGKGDGEASSDAYSNVASTTINVTPSSPASLSIAASSTIICAGNSVTFTATPTNGGTPSYQWKVAGVNSGTNSPTFTTTSLTNGQVVTCVMTSNATCVTGSPATSNSITITVNQSPTSITANASSAVVCPGGSVTYQYATSSNGSCSGANNWEYQWENTSGGVVRAWSTTANFTTTISNSTTYRLRMRCSGCPSSTSLSNDVTVNVYSVSTTTPSLSSPANNSALSSTPATLSWTGSLSNHPNSRYEVQLNGGAWTSTGSSNSYSASLNIGSNTWSVRYYDGCSGTYYTSGTWTVYYTPVSSCGNVDHGGNNWTISSNITVSGNHTNIGTFTINNGVTVDVDATCHYFNVEATTINILGTINGNGAGSVGGSGGSGGAEAFNSPDDYCNGGFGGMAGTAGQGTGGGASGTNGGNASCVDQICGNLFCIGNENGYDGGGGGAGGGAGGSYGGAGAYGAVAARGCSGNGSTGGTWGSVGAPAATYGTATGSDISWGSGGAGGGGGGGAYSNGSSGGGGGAGGGQVSLKATQTLTISGTIACNGTNGGVGGNASGESADNNYDCISNGYNSCSICSEESFDYAGGAGGAGGAGSGGGILIQSCGTLNFTGSLSANGGTGGSAGLPNSNHGTCFDWASGGAAGGGGRIKIFRNPCESNTITGSTTANSGSGGASTDGHTGSTGSAGSVQTAINHPSYVALSAGSIGNTQTVCTGGDLAAFVNTLSPSGGNCAQSYTYQWMKCTSGCGTAPTNYSDISGATAITFDEGNISQTTYYVRKVISGNCTAYTPSVIATVVLDPIAPTATKSPNTASVCEGQTLTLINPVDNGGGTGSCQINYRYSSTIAGLSSASWSSSIPSTTVVIGNFYIEMQKVCSGTGCDASPITQYSWIVNSASSAPTAITGTTTICNGGSTTLTVNGGSLGTGASWNWYSGSCGGTSVGTGTSVNVSPTANTTYYVRAEGTCNTTTCANTTVTVNSLSTAPTSITGTTTICNGGNTTLSVSGGSLGTGASWNWYSGSCGGTSVGTGISVNVSPTANTTYYVRAEGTCNTTTCANTTVTVNTPSVAPTAITGTTTICNGGSTTLTSSGGSLGTDATNIWYSGSCGTDIYNQPWTNQPFGDGSTTVNSVSGGILNVTSTTNDPMIYMGGLGSFDPAIYKYIHIRYRVTAGTAGSTEIFFYNTNHNWAVGGETGYGSLISDGAWHIVSVDMSADPDYTTGGNILGWRFDWATASGVTMDIDYISLSNTQIIGEGSSIIVSPTSNTTYYTANRGACNTTSCSNTTVTVNSLSTAPTSITGTTTICNGGNTTLSVSGGSLGTGASWKWYSGSCGGTSVGTGISVNVSPTANTTYYVRAEGTCNTTTCATTTVTVNSLSTAPTSITGTTTICNGGNTTLSVSGGSLGT
ncbi:MAG: hypothetical protein WCP69_15500, partial [Bacteroidota bacterium]